jgi:hypothetical protein
MPKKGRKECIMKLMKLHIFVLMFVINGCGTMNLTASTGSVDNPLDQESEIRKEIENSFKNAIRWIGDINAFFDDIGEKSSSEKCIVLAHYI